MRDVTTCPMCGLEVPTVYRPDATGLVEVNAGVTRRLDGGFDYWHLDCWKRRQASVEAFWRGESSEPQRGASLVAALTPWRGETATTPERILSVLPAGSEWEVPS